MLASYDRPVKGMENYSFGVMPFSPTEKCSTGNDWNHRILTNSQVFEVLN